MSIPVVAVENAGKRYAQGLRPVVAIEGVSFTVEPGQFISIMGPSGSGKSTLLHLLAGLTCPDSGRVLIAGQDIGTMADAPLTRFRRRHIGLVFQSFNLLPTLSARENLTLPLILDRQPKASFQAKADRVLAMLGLESRADHRPDALSGGEQQRVAIGRALINEPELILADEPTGNLDSVSSQGVCKLLADLAHQHGRTVITVTHEPAVAAYSDRILVIRDGRLRSSLMASEFPDVAALAAAYRKALENGG